MLHDNMEALLSCSDEGEAMTVLGRSEVSLTGPTGPAVCCRRSCVSLQVPGQRSQHPDGSGRRPSPARPSDGWRRSSSRD